MEYIIKIMIMANGKDIIIASFCNVSKPPDNIKAIANNACMIPHIIFFLLLGFKFPLDVNIAKTKTAESAEVIKNVVSSKMKVNDKTLANG
ncbi:hypothetical protein SDC9_66118 [bioreactor metagenome]|uniref:Uncharacterized protein n=1 Tax=bioreactor metagenome TaxID=1076179 RepID=A0A644XU14_9ZZZZ